MAHAVDLDIPNGVPIIWDPNTLTLTLLNGVAIGSVSPAIADPSRAAAAAASAAAAAVPVVDVAHPGVGNGVASLAVAAGRARSSLGSWLRMPVLRR